MNDSSPLSLEQVIEDELKAIDEALSCDGETPAKRSGSRIGLALSGGGIRSATFSLGVLQSLARNRRLESFDYLSTVSGGGYIGSWLSAWIHRQGLEDVQKELGRCENTKRSAKSVPVSDEPPEVTWLRRYSSYLAPRSGLFSLDSLTLLTTWLRNFLLNLIVLLGFLCCMFLAPYLLLSFHKSAVSHRLEFGFAAVWWGFVFLLGIAYNLWQQTLSVQRRRNWLLTTAGVGWTVVMPGMLGAIMGPVWLLSGNAKTLRDYVDGAIVISVALLVLLGAYVVFQSQTGRTAQSNTSKGEAKPQLWSKRGLRRAANDIPIYILATIAALFVFLATLYLVDPTSSPPTHEQATKLIAMATWGPPCMLVAICGSSTVFIGIVGRRFFEQSREWWSRLNAWLLTLAAIWVLWFLLATYALPAFLWLESKIGGWISLIGTGWIGALLAALYVRKPQSGSPRLQLNVERVMNTAAVVFIAGLLFLVAAGTQWCLLQALQAHGVSLGAPMSDTSFMARIEAHASALGMLNATSIPPVGASIPVISLIVIALITLLFGWRVDINKFSLHNMYKNRLVRCYLGASNGRSRNEQPFTGLDDRDDIALKDLAYVNDGKRVVQRPLHLFNTTLNITQGKNLAWQERKAASFTFSPLHCGYSLARTQGDSTSIDAFDVWDTPSYRRTDVYATADREERGFKLGMALATSGAAVSPNMGYASKPARAFVLTMFNVRLGRWSSNPAEADFMRPSPRVGLIALLTELLGISRETSRYVYLSDGGHFDNLGVYELVRRRCKVILAIDAGADPTRAFRDLGDTIRKCRIDLGVEITFPGDTSLNQSTSPLNQSGFCIGRICYVPEDPGEDGALIVIKPTLSTARDEPVDLLHYAAENASFPQQSTADQFFDESQFESYRRLGLFITDKCLKDKDYLRHFQRVEKCPPKIQLSKRQDEAPTFASCMIHALLPATWRIEKPAPREGSLIDFAAVFFLLSIVCLLVSWMIDIAFFRMAPWFMCQVFDSCKTSPLVLINQSSASKLLFGLTLAKLFYDNLVILLCAGAVATAYTQASPSLAVKGPARWLQKTFSYLVPLVAVIGCAGNAAMLAALIAVTERNAAIERVITLKMFEPIFLILFLIGFVWLSAVLLPSFIVRWHRPETI